MSGCLLEGVWSLPPLAASWCSVKAAASESLSLAGGDTGKQAGVLMTWAETPVQEDPAGVAISAVSRRGDL